MIKLELTVQIQDANTVGFRTSAHKYLFMAEYLFNEWIDEDKEIDNKHDYNVDEVDPEK